MDKVAFESVTDGGADASPLNHKPVASVASNVSLKLPAFWPDATEVWITQADAQFAIKHVMVSKTKFYPTVAILPQEVAAQHLIRTPPAVNT